MVVSDLHVHSLASCDSDASIWEMCERACEFGIEAIAFTEHLEFRPKDLCYRKYDYGRAISVCEEARTHYEGTLKILFGVEVTYWSDIEDEIRAYLSRYPFDLVIGSVHDAPPIDFWSPARADYVSDNPDVAREAMVLYFDQVRRLALSGLFDIVGHLGIYKRYIQTWPDPIDDKEIQPALIAALDAIVKNCRLELNAATLHRPIPLPLPSVQVLRIYKEMGGLTPTYGSDAHSPSRVGKDLNIASELVREAGFDEFATWRDVIRPTGPLSTRVAASAGGSESHSLT
ncbi:MAG: histidinol-phosphatase HisJ family protein [Firmicutes bacterium]|nr:histidinol-phosphatase HisJ family protein [Candidatus Fermentithermobacillaceae bacterium]